MSQIKSEIVLLTDEELMSLYQNGNEMAFRVLYDRYSSKIYGFLKKRIHQEEKVTEVYQDVFVKIHRSKQLYNKSLPVLPWFFTITRSVMLDYFKKEKVTFVNEFDFDQLSTKSDFDSDQSPKTIADAEAWFKKLPENQSVALQMRFVDEKTFDEISKTLKTTPTNVRQIISRGLKRLKEIINEGDAS